MFACRITFVMLFHARQLVSTFVESPCLGKEMFCQSIYSIHLFVLNIYKYICLLMSSVGSSFLGISTWSVTVRGHEWQKWSHY